MCAMLRYIPVNAFDDEADHSVN